MTTRNQGRSAGLVPCDEGTSSSIPHASHPPCVFEAQWKVRAVVAGDKPRAPSFVACVVLALALALALAASGCGGPPLLADILPVSARLESDKRVDVGVIGSMGFGGGTMVITDDSGATFRVPVSTHGVGLGALIEMSASEGALDIDLAGADVPRATDLFTHYEGSRGEIVLAFGASYLELESEFGARMSGWLLGAGTSIWAGHQWVFIEPAGDVVERPPPDAPPAE